MRSLLVALALVAALPEAAPAAGTIRVALMETAQSAEFRGADIEVAPLGAGRPACDRCRGWRADVVRAVWTSNAIEVDGRRAPRFRLWSGRPIRLGGREYGAAIELISTGGGMAIVNDLPLEDYLVGVLRAEADERWPMEVLRAQAIVARTYAAYHRRLNTMKPYHILASVAHQQFAGRVPAISPMLGAVQETAGQVLRLDGELFPAFYHTECGGHTEDPRLVFATGNLPALKPVVCPFSAESPHFHWTRDLDVTELSELLRRQGVDVGRLIGLEVTERTPSLRVVAVTLRGTRGLARLRGTEFRRMVGYDVIKSTLFSVAVDDQKARFAGRGYGHGVGLCQWGAKGMAEQGYTAWQILAFYYPGATPGALEGR
ncbi:MAG TPA: SpoIID/LytB domain-containing protein [Methylomirabilota bacterium]|nr:SpoIID/LytB domain-containing protein [Methylomirabilota bacterium]